MADTIGRIILPGETDIWPHELSTAKALAKSEYNVEFLP